MDTTRTLSSYRFFEDPSPKRRAAIHCVLGALVSFLAGTATVADAAIPSSERTALLAFYNATNGTTWVDNTGWLDASGTECNWFGVTCDAAATHVTELNLPGNGLKGQMPDPSPFTKLQVIGLNDNALSGSVPNLSNLTDLKGIYLHNNSLSGNVPSWNALAPLEIIDVQNNSLTGSIPLLNATPTLLYGLFANNLITGSIPDLSGLSNLKYFKADANLLSGSIPSLTGLNAIEVFSVARNNLTGNIPAIAGLSAIWAFDVSNNQLTGALPSSYPSGLQQFYASNNSLSGPIPSLAATQLQLFRVEGNTQLAGQVAVGPSPNTLVAGLSGLCPSNLSASNSSQVNSQWDTATAHTPWNYGGACAQQATNVFGPAVIMSFNPSNIVIGGTGSQMTVTLGNTNAQAIAGVAFSDSYPAGITNAAGNPVLQNSCGGMLTLASPPGLTLSGGSIGPHSSCTISIAIKGVAAGTWFNSTGPVTSTNASTNQTPHGALLGVSAANHPPVAQDDQIQVVAFASSNAIVGDARIPASVLDNDTDPDQGDHAALATIAVSPACGNLTLNPDGTFVYSSTTDQCATDTFQYNACDTFTLCAQGTVHIAISGANPNFPPVPVDDAIQVAPGGASSVLTGGAMSLLDNDFDQNLGQSLSIGIPGTWFSNYGTYTVNANGTFTYQNTDLNATSDEFEYIACDNASPLPACTSATVRVAISDVPNHLPIAVDDTANVAGIGGSTSVLDGGAHSVLANDSDPDPGQTATLTVFAVPNGGPKFGTLTLNGDGTFNYQNTDPNAVTDSFLYQVRDVLGATSIAKVTIEITDTMDQLPIANSDALQVAIGGTATTLTGGASSVLANDSDPDVGETATLAAHAVGGQPAHGQLVLNADGTFSYHHNGDAATSDTFAYEAVDAHGGGNATTVNITIGNGPINLPPIAVDDSIQVAPGATSSNLLDGASSVLDNDFDPNPGDTATMTAQLAGSAPAHGTLTFHADGTFSYHAFGGPPTTDSFSYKACDSHNACTQAPATVSITIGNSPADSLPIAIDDAIQVAPGGLSTTLVGGADSVLANDNDPDPGETSTLTAKLISSNPTHGTLVFNSDGTFSYQHNGDTATVDSFVYEARDVHGGSSSAVVTVTIGNSAANHLPFATDDAIDVAPGATSTKLIDGATSVLANDVDPDAGETAALTAKRVGAGPSHGTLTLNVDGTFNYQNFMGDPATTDVFQYEACDIHGACAEGVVTISVGAGLTNHLPIVVDDEIQVAPSGSATTLVGGSLSVLTNDFDPDVGETATLSAVKVSGLFKSSGTLVFNPDGTLSYQNQNPGILADKFLYEACDLHGACKMGTVTVTITNSPINHAPGAAGDAIQVALGGTATTLLGGLSTVLANDSDPDPGDGLTLVAELIEMPDHGSVTLTLDGAFSYHHNGDAATSDSFAYEACDIHGACNAATVSIAIGNGLVNTPPVAVNDFINVASAGTAVSLAGGANSVLANDSDADSDTLVAELVTGPTHGTLIFNIDGTFSYHNNGDASTNDAFSYRAQDVHLAFSNVAIVQIIISSPPDNHPPVAVDDAIQVSSSGTATTLVSGASSVLSNDSDPDGDPLSATVLAGPVQGTLSLNSDGTFSYHNTNPNASSDSFQYRACDNITPPQCASATVAIAIGNGSSNHAPIAVGDAIQTVPNGAATTLVGGANSVLANDTDPDADPLTAVVVIAPTHGTLTLNSDGTFSYHNTANASSDSFQYNACDGGNPALCMAATVIITIGNGPANHPPFAVDDAIDVPAAGMVATSLIGGARSVLANDADPDVGDTINASQLAGPTHGTLIFASDGSFTYTNSHDGVPTDSFTYEGCDNHGACDVGVVTITIGSGQLDRLPIVVDDAIQTTPLGTATTLIGGLNDPGSVLDNDIDPDLGDTLVASKASGLLNASGDLVFLPDGTFSYTNTDPTATTDSFLYEACDELGACKAGIVTITIGNDPPDLLPIAMNDALVVGPNGSMSDLVGDANVVDKLLDNDTDVGDTLTAYLISAPINGDALVNPDGTFTYTNTKPGPGVDAFEYEACDSFGACASAAVSVTIDPSAPSVTCVLPSQLDMVGDAVNFDLSLLFTPPPGKTLSYSVINAPPPLSIMGSLLSGILDTSGIYMSTLKATTVPGGVSATEDVKFEVLPAGDILLRNGFEDTSVVSQPCQ